MHARMVSMLQGQREENKLTILLFLAIWQVLISCLFLSPASLSIAVTTSTGNFYVILGFVHLINYLLINCLINYMLINYLIFQWAHWITVCHDKFFESFKICLYWPDSKKAILTAWAKGKISPANSVKHKQWVICWSDWWSNVNCPWRELLLNTSHHVGVVRLVESQTMALTDPSECSTSIRWRWPWAKVVRAAELTRVTKSSPLGC